MRFGLFDHMEWRGRDLSALYEERLQLLELADQAGFWCYHKAEHHFIYLDGAPSANVFLAAASQRTEKLRFGPLVYLLPFYHPLRLAEEISMLDHLSGGRMEIGVGKGISPPEHRFWGLEPDHARAQFEEAFDVLRQALAKDVVTHDGTHYEFSDVPVPMGASSGRMPGFWYPGNVAYAGEHRLNTVASGPVEALTENAGRFRAAVQYATRDWNPGVAAPQFAVKRHVFVAPTSEVAHQTLARAYPVYHDNLAELWKRFDVPFPNLDPSFGGDYHAALRAQDLLIGTPYEVAAHIERLRDEVGASYFIGAFAFGGLGHAEAMASLQLFIDEVMPRFSD